MTRPPAFQFYPGDWQRDPALQSCTLAARGLWMEMLCIMHQSEPYGHLKINNKVVEISTLSRLVGSTARESQRLVNELETAGVFQRDKDGAIFSKRMVNDGKLRQIRAECGKRGGNPKLKHLVNQKDNHTLNHPVNYSSKQSPTPSSSSSSSISPNPLRGQENQKPKVYEERIIDTPFMRATREKIAAEAAAKAVAQ